MARTEIPVQIVPANGGGEAVTKTAADATNGMYFVNDGTTTLYVQNLDASSKTVTVQGVADQNGRVTDTTLVVAAASGGDPGVGVIGPFPRNLFNVDGGRNVEVDFSAATSVKVFATRPQAPVGRT